MTKTYTITEDERNRLIELVKVAREANRSSAAAYKQLYTAQDEIDTLLDEIDTLRKLAAAKTPTDSVS